MIKLLKGLFGAPSPKPDYAELCKNGALVLDVRSKGEFAGGHIPNAKNIPVDELRNNLSKLKNKEQTIICCCASGMRSGVATRLLKAEGYKKVYNGGSWFKLQTKL